MNLYRTASFAVGVWEQDSTCRSIVKIAVRSRKTGKCGSPQYAPNVPPSPLHARLIDVVAMQDSVVTGG